MGTVSDINNIDLNKYVGSYTLTFLLERILSGFYDMTKDEKIEIFNQFDKEISEKLQMPRANFVFENKEFTLDTTNIYMGSLENIKSGCEFIGRYLFEKRQQYQRICVASKDRKGFSEVEFDCILDAYEQTPITRKNKYIPFSRGLKGYVCNYNKVDAMFYMFDSLAVFMKCIDNRRVSSNMKGNYSQTYKLVNSMDNISKFANNFYSVLEKVSEDEPYLSRLEDSDTTFRAMKIKEIITLRESISMLLDNDGVNNKKGLVCFNDLVWQRIGEDIRADCVKIANDLICSIVGSKEAKDVSFENGVNNYLFGDTDTIYIGDIKNNSGHEILTKLIYAYSFNKAYEEIMTMDEVKKDKYLTDYKECRKRFLETKRYDDIKDFKFAKRVRRLAIEKQLFVYFYINNNLYIGKERVKMPIGVREFVADIFKSNQKRR